MAKFDDKTLNDLMWVAHWAEGNGVLVYGTRGIAPDIRKDEEIEIKNEEQVSLFNLGVSSGVKAMLETLSEHGYKIVSPSGITVKPFKPKVMVEDQPPSYGDSFGRWLTDYPPQLRLVKK